MHAPSRPVVLMKWTSLSELSYLYSRNVYQRIKDNAMRCRPEGKL